MFDRTTDAFEQALDEAGRSQRGASHDLPRPQLRATMEFGADRGGGGGTRWDLAMIWADEPAESFAWPAASPGAYAFPGADMSEAIAKELGVGAALTQHQLVSRWRAFIWRNHPDRQPPHARERANARVAIANALYDRARRETTR